MRLPPPQGLLPPSHHIREVGCSISTRDWETSARTVPCSTRDFACGHRRQDGRHGRCPAEERVEAQERAAGEARHMVAAQIICTTPLLQPFCPIWAGLASRQDRAWSELPVAQDYSGNQAVTVGTSHRPGGCPMLTAGPASHPEELSGAKSGCQSPLVDNCYCNGDSRV